MKKIKIDFVTRILANSATVFIFLAFFSLHTIAATDNLLKNPGAADKDGWIFQGGFKTIKSGLTQGDSHTGGAHFYGGTGSPTVSSAYQDIDVSEYADAIDAGLVSSIFSGWIRTRGDGDAGQLVINFIGSDSHATEPYLLGTWKEHIIKRTVPKGVRTIRVEMVATRKSGFGTSVYFDDLSFVLDVSKEVWSIALSATDGASIDANNIVAVAYGAKDSEDERDARAVPPFSSQLNLSFVDRNKVDFDRDTRPADDRLSHHWFFSVENAQVGVPVQIFWEPAMMLRQDEPQYQVIRLVEFDAGGNVTNTITLKPKNVEAAEKLPIGAGALNLDGNDWMTVNHSGSLPNGTITMMGWIKPTKSGGTEPIFTKLDDNPGLPGYALRGYWLGLNNEDKVRFVCGADFGENNDDQSKITTDIEIPTNQWSHIAWTFEPSTTALKIYVDGVLGYEKQLGHGVDITIPYRPLELGKDWNNTGYFTGLMDEVSAWNRVLMCAEIKEKMFKSLSGDEDGLVGYWAFDEAEGNTVVDGSPKGNNGTLNGNPTIVSPSKKIGEGALHFDGVDDYVDVGDINLANQSLTLAAWAKRERTGEYDWIISQGQADTNLGLQFGFGHNNLFYFGFYSNDLRDADKPFLDSDWHYWVGTYDANTKERKIYQDGQLVVSDTAKANYQGSGNLNIGRRPFYPLYFKGQIDEVSIWNRALSQAEIQRFIDKPLIGNENGLVGYWTFEEGSGGITYDKSLNDNNGTLHGTPNWTTWEPPLPRISGAWAYEYIPAEGEEVRFFRLDVQKTGFVATAFEKGSSGWKFLSVPITPQESEPFVNLGDDIEPFKLYKYDTKLNGYKIYPLDIGEVDLQTGHGYLTRLSGDVEVDVGGEANVETRELELKYPGWHAIGNPFVKPVNIADLELKLGDATKSFADAVSAGWIEGTLYRWKVDKNGTDAYEAITVDGEIKQLTPWDGVWLKTKSAGLMLTIPAPAGLDNYIPPLPPSFDPPMAPSISDLKKGEFDLRFALSSDFASDLTTTLGTRQNAKVGFDVLDTSEPPTLEGTVSAYFEHKDWENPPLTPPLQKGGKGGLYNTDYQPALKVGETRTWQLVVYSNQPDAKMRLSWEKAIGVVHEVTTERSEQVPSDIMLSFRRITTTNEAKNEWQDMRAVQSVTLDTQQFITKVTVEIRAERFEMAPLEGLKVIADEKQVAIKWTTSDNPFITGYTIYRMREHSPTTQHETRNTKYEIPSTQHEFIDADVEEEATYTYQVSVRFKTDTELKSGFFTVTVLPIIKKTRLLQSYPNPFNPDTWIPYELKEESRVIVEIYNVAGQLVHTLNLGTQPRGRYISKDKAAHWDGCNEFGERAASGVYFYIMRAKNFSATRKMLIVK